MRICPVCNSEFCECEGENRSTYTIQISDEQHERDGGDDYEPTFPDFSSIYDCVSDFSGYPRDRTYRQHNPNLIGKNQIFNVGDLVRWYPTHGFHKPKQVWIIQKILNPSLMDSGWYDYEITDGGESHMVTSYELFKVREVDNE